MIDQFGPQPSPKPTEDTLVWKIYGSTWVIPIMLRVNFSPAALR